MYSFKIQEHFLFPQVWCGVGGLFHHEINILTMHCDQCNKSNSLSPDKNDSILQRLSALSMASHDSASVSGASEDTGELANDMLSVLSSAPLTRNSPLKSELKMKPKDTPTKKTSKGCLYLQYFVVFIQMYH